MITPFPAGGLFNRSTMNAKLEEIGGAITEASWQLIQILDNTGPMSGTWTAPDFFGDGSAYDLGVYMIGGGQAGHASPSYAAGGSSGYGKNFIINNVAIGSQFPYVIGSGGVASGHGGQAGGTTSFSQVGVDGGGDNGGGQGPDEAGEGRSPRILYGCVATKGTGPNYQPSREGQNQFDPSMITLSAGGWGRYRTQVGSAQAISAMPDGTKGGDGAFSASESPSSPAVGQSATGYGNGGGGAVNPYGYYTPGSGSDGAIYLYARRSQEVTA